jgi:hypothetical protein
LLFPGGIGHAFRRIVPYLPRDSRGMMNAAHLVKNNL